MKLQYFFRVVFVDFTRISKEVFIHFIQKTALFVTFIPFSALPIPPVSQIPCAESHIFYNTPPCNSFSPTFQKVIFY